MFCVVAPNKQNPPLWNKDGRKLCFQLDNTQRKQKDRVTGGEEKPGKRSLISANSSMPGLGNTNIHVRAKTGMQNPPGICWHDGTPYAHVWHALTHTCACAHTHTHAGVCYSSHWVGGWACWDINMTCVLHITNAFTSGWKGDERGMGDALQRRGRAEQMLRKVQCCGE